ncbi:MAG: cryptochrome/photolyase family protein [Timaviella obliquedivisa GSE-PSE-MK23-08B]|jgi:deoxyribodipyrimidine photolyase-related protein|nr:cryptochrome/photolyase family protein [Timaviella obliquedivisa GSE-PSE-MK23-08B]
MTTGIWILGDQLWMGQSAIQGCPNSLSQTPIILIESWQHVRERPYHQQKLVLVWSAMRHFAQELRHEGSRVTYKTAEAFEQPLQDWVRAEGITQLRVMEPSDRPFAELIQSLDLPCEIILTANNRFLWTTAEFRQWTGGRKSLVMEYFYREGRQRFQILMEGRQPVGGQWNFDKENRQPPKTGLETPEALWFEPDDLTQSVIHEVKHGSFSTYGEIEPFRWGVTRSQAQQVLAHFIQTRLPRFGTYQDAMMTGEETLWHAMLSAYLNLGLLQPLEVIRAAEQAFYDKSLGINSVEGFIRQILGWREYMHGLYHYVAEDYSQLNWFNHTQPLPEFYWDADKTDMNCLHQTLKQVESMAYGHHIQRLMVLSNFALIAGVVPQAIENWFHSAFIDAYDWVMQTNVIGMGQFADGGILASKPYAASANYINKMSDYCKGCCYNYKERTGDRACPFNFFYWDFLARHRDRLTSQGRMSFILKNLDKIPISEQQQISQKAEAWLSEQKS